MSRGSAIVGFLLCFLAGMALMWSVGRAGGAHGATHVSVDEAVAAVGDWSHEEANVPVSSKDPLWGSVDAPVTVVVFSDYQCPQCSHVADTLDALKKKYGPEKMRVAFRHFPLPSHKNAVTAHAASDVVFQLGGNPAFWKFHDLAFDHPNALTMDNLIGWAMEAGIEKTAFVRAMTAERGRAKVKADVASGKALRVKGTPSFFINGKQLAGGLDRRAFENEINAQLQAAAHLVKNGTPPSEVYVALSKRNFPKTPLKPKDAKQAPQDTATVWKVPLNGDEPSRGNPNALVTIVEFAGFQCTFSKKALKTIATIEKAYGDQVRVVFIDRLLAFHKRSVPAARLAHEARAQLGESGFWKAHDLLFEKQDSLEEAQLLEYAATLGLNAGSARAAITGKKFSGLFERYQDLATDLVIPGTPQFFINGRRLRGPAMFSRFKPIIDEEIARAKAMLAKGVQPAALYDKLIEAGKEPAPPEKKNAGAVPENAPSLGADDAPLVIHAFSDFQCPFCSRIRPKIDRLAKDFAGKIKIVWRHRPLTFHKKSKLAHQAAQEAFAQQGNAGFWAMHDKLFENQKALDRENLEKLAAETGLDMARFNKALDDKVHLAFVEREIALAEKLGIRSTPGFVIGTYYLSGEQPYSRFRKYVKLALDHGT